MAAIRVMMANIRWIWDEKVEDGRTVLRRIAQVIGGGSVAADEPIEFQPDLPLVHPRWQAIRTLAANMVGETDETKHYAAVSRTDAQWLALLTRTQLCRIATASDETLENHMRQRQMMPGICAADKESVLARTMADERALAGDREHAEIQARTDALLEAVSYGAPKMPGYS